MFRLTIVLLIALPCISSAETSVFGYIGTSVWQPESGPYHVTDTLYLRSSESLTLRAGTEVVFDARVPFIVDGRIVLEGSEDSPVTFASGDSRYWSGIVIRGGDTSSISHTQISGARIEGEYLERVRPGGGISISGPGTRVYMSDVTVTGCESTRGGGIWVGSSADAMLTRCRIENNTARFEHGGGICVDSASITLIDCLLKNNRAYWGKGGGIALFDGLARINGTTIQGNDAAGNGGGVYPFLSDVSFEDCGLLSNSCSSDGAGMYADSSEVSLLRCTVRGNMAYDGGGGVSAQHMAHVAFDSCTIVDNACGIGRGAGLCCWRAEMDVRNTLIARNSSFDHGGGLCIKVDSRIDLTNCTIANNYVMERDRFHFGGMMTAFGTVATFRNTIFYGNSGNPLGNSGAVVRAYYCVLDGQLPDGDTQGTEIRQVDPLFHDAVNGDYHLRPESPCIDAGDPASPLDANGTRADIGAFGMNDFDISPTAPTPPGSPTALDQNIPNPFNPSTTIRFNIAEPSRVYLAVYDAMGREVRVLINRHMISSGRYEILWDGLDSSGQLVASGVYVSHLKTPGLSDARRMVLVR
jgi:hypothetical protein